MFGPWLQVVRRILNLAASEWMDSQGLTSLHSPAKIKLFPNHDRRGPYPLRWDEQTRLGELGTWVFIVPGDRVKNGDERLVVLNSIVSSGAMWRSFPFAEALCF